MDVQRLFDDLESNNPQESEEAKKTLAEFANQTKDQSILQGLMDYYIRTGSARIVDVLVKVQSPIDICVLDRIADWMRSQHRIVALDLLGCIIRKQPTWLYKIAKHKLIKEIIKLLQTEKEIIHLMSALLCIITLLPIIPSLVPSFLIELEDGFGHLAAWSAQNSNVLPASQIIHVQIGIYLLFHYLYGMYPNSFIRYLRRFASKDSAIFQSTIRPLLETVRLHPMLVSSSSEDETSNLRWKEKEPHDIVVECAKLTLDYNQENVEYFCKNTLMNREQAGNHAGIESLRSWQKNPALYIMSGVTSPFRSLVDSSSLLDVQKTNPIWSPSFELLSTPPPAGAVTLTPTPNYNVPSMSATTSGVLEPSGTSPPEAAVEATPETTPLKDANVRRTLVEKSPAVRALLASSQPTSPMRLERSPFRFDMPATSQALLGQPNFEQGLNVVTASNHRLLQILSDRDQSQKHMLARSKSVDPSGVSSTSAIQIPFDAQPLQMQLDSPTSAFASTQEDLEVSELTNTNCATNHSDTLQDLSAECGDETEQSPSSISACPSLNLQERRALRNRQEHSGFMSFATSPAEHEHGVCCTYMRTTIRVRRSCSLPAIRKADESSTCDPHLGRLGQFNFPTNGGSSSPSGDDAVSAATHFKQVQQKSKMAKKLDGRSLTCVRHSGTQTSPQWHCEEKIFELYLEQNKLRQKMQKKHFDPYEMFDQWITRNESESKVREDVLKDQIKLLHLMLNFERYRREVHAERNRRLLGKSRNVRSLEKDEEKMRDQIRRQQEELETVLAQLDKYRKKYYQREGELLGAVNSWKMEYHKELETSKQLVENIEKLQRKLNDEKCSRKEMALQIEALRGEIFDMRNEMQQLQYQAELGLQYKQELVKLQTEFLAVGEIQVKARDKLTELESLKARDEDAELLREAYTKEIKEMRSSLEAKSAQFDTVTHLIGSLQANNVTKDVHFTDQKRLFKGAKEEYDEKLKALERKYEAQKTIILQMEERIGELYKSQMTTSMATTTPESERTDFISSMEHNSPLSVSLTSNEGLSTSLKSITEIRNLQALVVNPPHSISEPSFGSIPVTASSLISQHQLQPTSSQAFASTSSSAVTPPRPSFSGALPSSYSTVSTTTSTSTSTSTPMFNEPTTSTRLQNLPSPSSPSSSAL